MPKGDYKKLRASTKDGNAVMSKLLLVALDSAPLPVDARRVSGYVVRRAYGNWDFSKKKRCADAEFSILDLVDALGIAPERAVDACARLLDWRLIDSGWKPGIDLKKVFRWSIHRNISDWKVPGFDAEHARRTFLAERKQHQAKKYRFKPRVGVKLAEADPSPMIQAYGELFAEGRNPACLSPEVLHWHRMCAKMLAKIGKPSGFQDAARAWLGAGNTVAALLGSKAIVPRIGPGQLDRRGASRLEGWLIERLVIEKKDARPEYLLEQKVRALFDIQDNDHLGEHKMLIARALVLDWVWMQELHGFETACVTRAAAVGSQRSLADVWLGLSPDELLRNDKSRKAAFLRFIRLLARGALPEKVKPQAPGKGGRAVKQPAMSTAKRPGLLYPPRAEMRPQKDRPPFLTQLKVQKLPEPIASLSQTCAKHGHEILESITSATNSTLLQGESVSDCTKSGTSRPACDHLVEFLDREIQGNPDFHNFHIVRTVSQVVGRQCDILSYRSHYFPDNTVGSDLNPASIRTKDYEKESVFCTGQSTRTGTGRQVFGQANCSKMGFRTGMFVHEQREGCKRALSAIIIAPTAPPDPERVSEVADKLIIGIGKTLIPTLNATRDDGPPPDESAHARIIDVWSYGSGDPTAYGVLSGLEYLLGWRGWRPVSKESFPVRRPRDPIPEGASRERVHPGGERPRTDGCPPGAAPPAPPAPPEPPPPPPPPAVMSPLPEKSPSGEIPVGDLEDALPPPLPHDPALLRAGLDSREELSQILGYGGSVGWSVTAILGDPDPAEGPFPAKRTATIKIADSTQLLDLVDRVHERGVHLCQECPKCHFRHGPLDTCVDWRKIAAECDQPFNPEDYKPRPIEELRAMSDAEFARITAVVEFPAIMHEDDEMGFRDGEDTLELFQRVMNESFGEPALEWAERFFDVEFIHRWMSLYDRIPFFSSSEKHGKRFRNFSVGLKWHMNSVISLVARLGVESVKEAYIELYFTPERRLRNFEGTLDTYVRLLDATLVQEHPSAFEPPPSAATLHDAMDVSVRAQMHEILNTGTEPKPLSRLLLMQNGDLMVQLASSELKYVTLDGVQSLDLTGIPDDASEDSTVVKFLLEVVHGKWLTLMPDAIRLQLFKNWFDGAMRYEHFRLVVRMYRLLKRSGHLVYSNLPEEFTLERLPFLTNEAALRVALPKLEGRGRAS